VSCGVIRFPSHGFSADMVRRASKIFSHRI
jgi:hypothetical protein